MKKNHALCAFHLRGKRRRKFVVFKPSLLRFSVLPAIVILYLIQINPHTTPNDSIYSTNKLAWSWNCLYKWCLFSEYNKFMFLWRLGSPPSKQLASCHAMFSSHASSFFLSWNPVVMPISYARNVNKVSFSLNYRLSYKDIVTASEAFIG